MRFVVAGEQFDLDADDVVHRLVGQYPAAIQTHWVDVEGTRWPPKQVLELATGIQRSRFISHAALGVLQRLGFTTSEIPRTKRGPESRPVTPAQIAAPTQTPAEALESLHRAVEVLADFVGAQDLTGRIAALEQQLLNVTEANAAEVVAVSGIRFETLLAALTVRNTLGRVSDIVHAAVIALALPHLLEPGEVVNNRPSLAAGNDPTRPFDLETTHRVAEFKVSVWKGADAMRKRGVFADLVHLALDNSGRRAQLFVVGDEPRRFLEASKSSASWGFTRGSADLRQRYTDRFGSLDTAIADVRSTHAAHVEIVDLGTVIPGVAALLARG
ncbi:MAG: PE-PGRS family protein [Ilumatobacteraceae bacterium]